MDTNYYEGVDVYVVRSELPTELDAINLLADIGAIEPMTNENGEIFTSEDGKIYIL